MPSGRRSRVADDPPGLTQAFELKREMGCTRADFLSWLPGATRHAPLHFEGDEVRVDIGEGTVIIDIGAQGERRLGSFALPVLPVSMRFAGMTAEARQQFLQYFDLYTRREGGCLVTM